MSKFCPNCGATLDDSANVCSNCGTTLASNPVNAAASAVSGVASNVANTVSNVVTPENKQKAAGAIKKFAPIVAVVAVVAIVIAIIASAFGPKAGAKKFVKAIMKSNEKAAVKMVNEDSLKADLEDDEDLNDMKDSLAERFDSMSESLAEYLEDELDTSKYKLKYKVTNVKDMSSKDFKDLKDQFKDAEVDFKIKKIKIVTVEVTAKKGSDTEKIKFKINMAKQGMGWSVFSIEDIDY